VILLDANLLLYAYDPDSPHHHASRRWLEEQLSGSGLVRFAWPTVWAFVRIITNPQVFVRPLSASEAMAAVITWLRRPNAAVLEPGERHLQILADLLERGQAAGPLVTDAVLAAIAVEHGATLVSTDRDFSRFPDLDWRNPLEG
jgi:hypothetical protein